jgi:hypothetical protein
MPPATSVITCISDALETMYCTYCTRDGEKFIIYWIYGFTDLQDGAINKRTLVYQRLQETDHANYIQYAAC